MARRLLEAGVRFVEVCHGGWDQHRNLREDHGKHAGATDQPIAGLLRDLADRGMLEDTLVLWGGEFGRTPYAQTEDGRDHNHLGYTIWMAGGGVRAGFRYGATDEFGYEAVVDKVHIHDWHATILHLLGLDHTLLTFRHAGRDMRLTDVSGRVHDRLLA
jgi:arylsulfatase A-like enzyme